MCVRPAHVRQRQLPRVNLWLSQLAETPVCHVVPYTSLLNHKLNWNTFNNYQRNVKCLFHLIFFHMNAPVSLSPTLACFLFVAVSFVQQLVLWHLIADVAHFLHWERSQFMDVTSSWVSSITETQELDNVKAYLMVCSYFTLAFCLFGIEVGLRYEPWLLLLWRSVGH